MKNINWYPPSRPSLGRYSSIALSRSLQTSTATVWGRPSTISPNLCYKNIKTSFHNHVLFWLCFLLIHTVDSLYFKQVHNCAFLLFLTICKTIKLQVQYTNFANLTYSAQLSEKKWDFKLCEECFSWFYEDINSSCLSSYLYIHIDNSLFWRKKFSSRQPL